MSNRKTGGNSLSNTIYEDNYLLLPDNVRRKTSFKKGPGKTLGISNLNSVPMKENPAKTEENRIELDKNTRQYSKILEFDIPKEYK